MSEAAKRRESKRTTQREEFYANMLNDGMAYIGYWTDDITRERRARLAGFTTNDMARGWQLLIKAEAAGEFSCCGSPDAVRRAERSLSAGDGDEGYDACVADAVIQLALLGSVVYG